MRQEHDLLNRVTLPLSSSFWDEHFPPNGWNCRCSVVQVRKGKYPETDLNEANARAEASSTKDPKGMFRFNAGKEKKAIPDYNPYTISKCKTCPVAKGKGKSKLAKPPKNELCEACRYLRGLLNSNKNEYHRLLKDPNYKDVQYNESTGGLKATHVEHNFDPKKGHYEKNVQEAGFLNGHSVIFEKEPQDQYKVKSCEGLWDGKKFEIGSAENATPSNVRSALKHCAKKPGTKIAVIYFEDTEFNKEDFYTDLRMFQGLEGVNGGTQYKKFDRIYCVYKTDIILSIIPHEKAKR